MQSDDEGGAHCWLTRGARWYAKWFLVGTLFTYPILRFGFGGEPGWARTVALQLCVTAAGYALTALWRSYAEH